MLNSNVVVIYANNSYPFDLVLIKVDGSFVLVGDFEISDKEIKLMTEWEDVSGWTMEAYTNGPERGTG